jgi:uncharacterized membrane protein YvbJ
MGSPSLKPVNTGRLCVECGARLTPGKFICRKCGHDHDGNTDFVAVENSNIVMRGLDVICRACSRNYARRIARLLNDNRPNRKGR